MSSGLVTAAYIVAAILFIFPLVGLPKQKIAKQGCYSDVAGMVEDTEKFNNFVHLENIDSEFSYAQ